MKRKLFISLLLISKLLTPFAAYSAEECSDSYSSLVFEEKTGDILFSKRADEASYPASLTKLMTLYLTFEAIENNKLKPTDILTFSSRGEEISAVNRVTTLHVQKHDTITVREAIKAVIVKSMNEAAIILAEAVSGNEWAFARKMNERAAQLGMINSSFRNATGLHAEGQYTTTYDLARLVVALKRDFPGYYHLFALKNFSYLDREYETHNHVLVEYKGAEGMKTGFTNASGFNLITSAKREDTRVVSVILGCATYKRRDEFTKELLDYAFDRLKNTEESLVAFKR